MQLTKQATIGQFFSASSSLSILIDSLFTKNWARTNFMERFSYTRLVREKDTIHTKLRAKKRRTKCTSWQVAPNNYWKSIQLRVPDVIIWILKAIQSNIWVEYSVKTMTHRSVIFWTNMRQWRCYPQGLWIHSCKYSVF